MTKKLLVYGAGAIGRGFIPWIFHPSGYEYYYVESNPELRNMMNQKKSFTTYKTINGHYVPLNVKIQHCFALGEEKDKIDQVDAVITAVGPRNILTITESLMNKTVPVICCENDSSIPDVMISITNNPNVAFAIPDVITSNTAPPELLKEDPLSVVTEDGLFFADKKISNVGGNCNYVSSEDLKNQWLAKLYIHNTPHCIAAYLGFLKGVTYLHESMQDQTIEAIVSGSMCEMEQMLLRKYHLDETFVKWYGGKELKRFRNVLLYDPISRVAREPFRKLAPNDRLIGAAELCLSVGIVPENIMIGIMSAFCYNNPTDPDFNIKYLVNSLDPKDFLNIIVGLRAGEPLFEMLLSIWNENISKIRRLKHE